MKKEKGTTIVTTVMSVILCWRWSWKRKKVLRLLQLWCRLYCVQDGPEKGKRYHDCYNCDVGYIVFKMVLKKEKGTTIVTNVMSVILCARWPWKRKKVPRLLQLWCLLYCVQDGPEKGKRYHDCYNCDVGYIVFKMVMKKEKGTTIATTVMLVVLCSRWSWKRKKVPRLLQLWCRLYCVQDGPQKEKVPRLLQLWCLLYCVQDGFEKEKRYHDCYNCNVGCIVFKMVLKKKKGTTIVTTVMSVVLCSRWPWKRKKVPRLLQLWCLLYCVQDGLEKEKRYHDCYNCDVGCIVFKMAQKKEKGTTIVTTVMSVILCLVTSTSNCHFTHVWNKITKNQNCSTELTMQVSKVVESMVMP
jgi:hypothetical protein